LDLFGVKGATERLLAIETVREIMERSAEEERKEVLEFSE
jgi:hypothetical protein